MAPGLLCVSKQGDPVIRFDNDLTCVHCILWKKVG